VAARIVSYFSPADPTVKDIDFREDATEVEADRLRRELSSFFPPHAGFGSIERLNYLDGVRITFRNGDVVHVRPSGNADELRVYAVADSQQRAEEIAAFATAEPDGILRQMEDSVSSSHVG
jgi:phosphomannomutase